MSSEEHRHVEHADCDGEEHIGPDSSLRAFVDVLVGTLNIIDIAPLKQNNCDIPGGKVGTAPESVAFIRTRSAVGIVTPGQVQRQPEASAS